MRGLRKSFPSTILFGAVMALFGLSTAMGQFDPLAGILAPPPPAGGQPGAPTSAAAILAPPSQAASQPGMRVGFLGVDQAAGRSYAGAQTKGVVNMANLRVLPKTVAPIPIRLKTSNTRNLAGKPRIAVPSYVLGVVQQSSVRASGAGAGTEIAPRASRINTVLIGVDDAMLMRLADEAHADLLRRLTEAGVDVVPQAELTADQDFAKIRILGQKDKGQGDIALYGPAAAPLIAGNPLTGSPMSMPGTNINLSSASATLNAVMLQPYLSIDYAALEGTGNRTYSGSAQVSAEVKFRIAGGGAHFMYGQRRGLGSGPGGTLTCDSTSSDELFGLMFEIDDRSDDVAVHNTFASLGMGSIYRQSNYYGVEVAPHRYEALVRAAFQGLNASIVSEIQKARG